MDIQKIHATDNCSLPFEQKKALCKLRPLPFENVWFCAFNYTVVVKKKI